MPKEDPFVNRAQLLKAIKKYPEIWDSNNKLHMCRSVTSPMWNEIAEQFGGHVPTVKLQSIWSQMKYHYHNLVHRQILHKDRFTTKWEHFEPMSFMYNITVAKILGATNGGDAHTAHNSAGQSESATGLAHATTPPAAPTTGQGRGRPSGSFTWLPSSHISPTLSSAPPTSIHELTIAHVGTSPTAAVSTSGSQHTFTGFTGLVPPAAITVETTTTPMRKLGRPSSLHNCMRGRIIDAIKARPPLWAGRSREQRQGQNRTSAVWKELSAELGLTPTLIQTRWSIIKQRYVDELQKERHAHYVQQDFHSNWEHFERMSFMRDILIKKVDEREQTREQIQEILSEQHHQQQQQLNTQTHTHLQHYQPRGSATLGLAEHAQDMPMGLVHHHPHAHHHLMHHSRRRVKTEADLEWDPFEMIMHVHGATGGTPSEPPGN